MSRALTPGEVKALWRQLVKAAGGVGWLFVWSTIGRDMQFSNIC